MEVKMNNRIFRILWVIVFHIIISSGCVITKIVTVPMRVGGAVVSIVPLVGDTMHDAIDEAAEKVDDLPL